ncbi:serine hydrolase [Aquipuribacter sp. SD81]|uniref:serine hydrolase n=1 Tax=Aquipuribacter sp. SD81 TaxID=3127703 RepID=UPI003016D7D0
MLTRAVGRALAGPVDGVRWSVVVRDGTGAVLAAHEPDALRSSASVGKLLLLLEVARAMGEGRLAADGRLARRTDLDVADSGLWQHLRAEALPVADLAVLVAALSDNLATNVLLDAVGGTAPVAATAAAAGLADVALLDRVRDRRGPGDPPRLSEGSAAGWSALVHRVAIDDLPWPGVAARVRGWLTTAVDTSMVASALHLDPLAHGGSRWWGKTGTDTDVRADVGHVSGPGGRLSYAAIAEGDLGGSGLDAVMTGMRDLGAALRAEVAGGPGGSLRA